MYGMFSEKGIHCVIVKYVQRCRTGCQLSSSLFLSLSL